MAGITYWLAEHPAIVGFRWSPAQSWGSTWWFLFSSIFLYLAFSIFLHLSLTVVGRRRPVLLGPVPALHSLSMAVVSGTIFLGLLLSSLAEIRDTRWFWRRSMTPFEWLLCFPLGTRPTGRVFFWSYMFYISRFLLLLRTPLAILQRRRLTFARLFNGSVQLCMSFLWLEFSQSFQVPAILVSSLANMVVFGYRFWIGAGLPVAAGDPACSIPVVLGCQVALMGCNLLCHVGVLMLHIGKGGCNGIGAWVFNSVLNGALLLLFLNSYVRRAIRRLKGLDWDDDLCISNHRHHYRRSEVHKEH